MDAMSKRIYAIPNYECNLNCPHCDIHKNIVQYNRENFIKTLTAEKDSRIILFGGEPTLFEERFVDICQHANIASVSTNLLVLTDKVFEILKQPTISIATSWNMIRFTDEQFRTWLSNLEKFKSMKSKVKVLITMTEDLIDMKNFEYVLNVLNKIDKTDAVSGILFEHLIADSTTEKFHQRCDDWLCLIHDKWNYSFANDIEQKVLDWNFDCSHTFTVHPNGTITFGCPQYVKPQLNLKCLSCENVTKCHPCALQSFCTFPHNLYKLIHKVSKI